MIKIIAETAFSHEGDFMYLKKQIEAAKKAESDFVKFQVFLNKEDYIVKSHPDYDKLDKWMFSESQWKTALNYAKSLNLNVLALPLNVSSAKFCLQNDKVIDMYEVHSICFNEVPLLNALKKTSKKIILGIGGRLPQEIDFTVNILEKKKQDIILMYGFQSFPTNKSMLNLSKIRNIKNLFNCDMGYADHSSYENDDFLKLNDLAYLQGAAFFEKHLVLEKGKKRVDYESAVSSDDFKIMRKHLSDSETILGDGNIFMLNQKEQAYKNREKQITANTTVKRGETIKKEHLSYKITQEFSDFEQKDFFKITEKKAGERIQKNEILKYKHLR